MSSDVIIAFRKAFRGFDVAKVAAMTARDVDRLVQDASIIRNRGKIQATVDNARAMTSASPSLAELAKSYEITRKRAPRSLADLPTSTSGGGGVREAVEVAGVPLRRAHERVRVHAERRRRQRPPSWMLPRGRLVWHRATDVPGDAQLLCHQPSSVPSDRVSLQSRMSFRSAKNQRSSILAKVSR